MVYLWRLYTFAAPNSTKTPAQDENIFNIINVNDLVPFVPLGTGWGKYGINIVFGTPNGENESAISVIMIAGDDGNQFASTVFGFRAWLARNFNIGIGGSTSGEASGGAGDNIRKNHGAEMYLRNCPSSANGSMTWSQAKQYYKDKATEMVSDMLTALTIRFLTTNNAVEKALILQTASWLYNKGLYNISVACPVNVTVRDSQGRVVALFENHELISLDSALGLSCAFENEDFMCLPSDEEYTVTVLALDDGVMNIQMFTTNSDNAIENSAEQLEVPLSRGTNYAMRYQPDVALPQIQPVVNSTLVLPSSLLRIESEAFAGIAVTSIIIPESCVFVDDDAFDNCPNLTTIINHSSVTINAPEGVEVINE